MEKYCLFLGYRIKDSTHCEACNVEYCKNCDSDVNTCEVCEGTRTLSKSNNFCVVDSITDCKAYTD